MIGKTLAEKIIGQHCNKEVKAGDFVIANIDIAMVQDGTGPLTIEEMREINLEQAANPKKTILFLDHAAPSPRKELSNAHKILRDFAAKTGCVLSDVDQGISHQRLVEDYVCPGDILIGADSHTCTSGALGAFATGMGSTDVGIGIALGKTWLKVPETFKIEISGTFKPGVAAKDLILHVIGLLGADGATYKALEFCGETVAAMEMCDRFTLCNMAVEAGAKTGMVAADEKTKKYLQARGRADCYKPLVADLDAVYERIISIDITNLAPCVACPHAVDNVVTIDKKEHVKVDQVFIGTCTNGRIEDLRIAAQILKDKKRNPDTRLLIGAASKDIFRQALKEGLIEIFVNAGATIINPGCGPCVGVHEGILGDNEVCLSTQNRNFQGRMGNPKGYIYLCSPQTAAYSAIYGHITDPRKYL